MSNVSFKSQVREMDAHELEQEWNHTSEVHKNHIKTRDYALYDITRYAEKFTLIAKEYHQITGKILD